MRAFGFRRRLDSVLEFQPKLLEPLKPLSESPEAKQREANDLLQSAADGDINRVKALVDAKADVNDNHNEVSDKFTLGPYQTSITSTNPLR